MLENIIRSENKIPTRHTAGLRLDPTHRSQHTQALCGGAVSFLCHGFCEPTHDSTFIFLKDKKKIKELWPTPRTKTHAKKTA